MSKKDIYNNKHWIEFRKALTDNKDIECFLCKKKKWVWQPRKKAWKSVSRFHIHHLSYANIGHETLDDVVALCPSCHNIYHAIMKRKPDSPFITELQSIATKYISEDRRG